MSIFWIIGFFVFFLGTAIGSFLNVLVYRSIRGQDWVNDRSVCEHCHKKIAWYENIPLFSYFFLQGKCSSCSKKIDIIHPLVEGLTGVLFLWWYVAGYAFFKLTTAPLLYIQPLFWLCVAILFVVIFVSDIRYMIIPDWAVAFLTAGTLLYRFIVLFSGEMQWRDFQWSLVWTLCFTVFFFSLWFFTKGKGFGFGDVKLAIPLGLILGSWQRIVVAVFGAFLLGALVGVFLLLRRKKKLGQVIPFGPFLLISTGLSLVWGHAVLAKYIEIVLR